MYFIPAFFFQYKRTEPEIMQNEKTDRSLFDVNFNLKPKRTSRTIVHSDPIRRSLLTQFVGQLNIYPPSSFMKYCNLIYTANLPVSISNNIFFPFDRPFISDLGVHLFTLHFHSAWSPELADTHSPFHFHLDMTLPAASRTACVRKFVV